MTGKVIGVYTKDSELGPNGGTHPQNGSIHVVRGNLWPPTEPQKPASSLGTQVARKGPSEEVRAWWTQHTN